MAGCLIKHRHQEEKAIKMKGQKHTRITKIGEADNNNIGKLSWTKGIFRILFRDPISDWKMIQTTIRISRQKLGVAMLHCMRKLRWVTTVIVNHTTQWSKDLILTFTPH